MKKGTILLVGIVVFAVLFGMFLVKTYNGLVGLDQGVKQAWSQVENQLQRRYDLIPNLVSTVKGYASHESKIFIEVAEARAKLAGAKSVNEKVQASNAMESVIGRLLVIVENYPQLKASANFTALQDELTGTENRLAVARMRYNEVVQKYNVTAKQIPTVFFAGMLGFDTEKSFFKTESEEAKKAPKVEF